MSASVVRGLISLALIRDGISPAGASFRFVCDLACIFDSLTHRHENATDAEQLVTASKPLANLLNPLRAAVPRLLLYLGQRYTNLMTARHVGRPPLNLEIIGKQQHSILAGETGMADLIRP